MKTKEKFEKLFNNEMNREEAKAFLVALYEKGESSSEIAAAASIMRAHSIRLPISQELQEKAIDVVGTGGDKIGSFNISTTVSLLLASLGLVVAKHGSRSITSNSGAADVLETLGVNLDLTPENQVAKKYLLGVFSPDYIERMAKALLELKVKRAFVVSSDDGMDEISLAATTQFSYLEGGILSHGIIDPEAFGFKCAPQKAIVGGSAKENAEITRSIFNQTATDAQRDIVLLNAGFALFADGRARDIQEAFEMAREALASGSASAHLQRIAEPLSFFVVIWQRVKRH